MAPTHAPISLTGPLETSQESSPKWDYIQQTKRHLKDRLQRRAGNVIPAVAESTIQYQGIYHYVDSLQVLQTYMYLLKETSIHL